MPRKPRGPRLFADAEPVRPPSSRPFQEAFARLWQAKFGVSYPWLAGGRDGAICKELWVALGGQVERFEEVVRRYFEIEDEYLRSRGYPIWALPTRLPQIVASMANKKKSVQTWSA